MATSTSMRKSFISSFIYSSILLLLFLVSVLVFSIVYSSTKSNLSLIFLISIPSLLFIAFVVVLVFSIYYVYKYYFKEVILVTKKNLETLNNHSVDFGKYPLDKKIIEFNELNDVTTKIKDKITNSTLVYSTFDYSNLSFEYVPGFENVLTQSSLRSQIENIIYLSNTFRNSLVELYYEIDIPLTHEEINKTISLIKQRFCDYENLLFALSDDFKSIFIYIPQIDTFSRLREQFISLIQNTSVIRDDNDGSSTFNARVVVVAYPYSDIHEIFHDLYFAKQEGWVVNIYLPSRIISNDDFSVRNNAIELNVASKIMESIGGLQITEDFQKEDFRIIIKNSLSAIMAFLNLDDAGVIRRNIDSLEYYSSMNVSSYDNSLFKEATSMDNAFIDALEEEKDVDHSYYFSTRSHANTSLGRFFDKYGIKSGFYYVYIDTKKNVNGIIYFFKRNNDLILNSYLREALVLYSNRIGDFLNNFQRNLDMMKKQQVVGSILMLSKYSTYRIDKESYEIISHSKNIKNLCSSIEVGKICYKTLFGFDKPCSNCPLATGKKTLHKYKDYVLEVSLNLTYENTARYADILLKQVEHLSVAQDRFNKDFLVNSFTDLVENVQNCYAMNSKGHLVLMRIDNLDNLVEKYGSEFVNVAIRTFLLNVKKEFGNVQNIYYFNSQTFAILCQESGQIDIVNRCEQIYSISKQKYFNSQDADVFLITYLPMVYPSSYPAAEDFLKNAQKYFDSNRYDINKDYIYFEENGYARPASRKDFMLSVIDDKFGNNTFTALLQPYLRAGDKSMYGVEMLLRLQDDYRNIVFNADELIKIAANNGKMKIISDALINYAGNLYQKQGSSIFKTFGFKRFSINIDYSYFKEDDAVEYLVKLIDDFHFPKYFIALEIPEFDIKYHLVRYKEIIDKMKKANVVFVVDQYNGQYVSVDKLKQVGFDEIKVSRSLGGYVDSDPQKAALLASIMANALSLDMQVSVVGIENNAQYEFVKNLNKNTFVQGYFFFKPLDKNALINALRSTNTH